MSHTKKKLMATGAVMVALSSFVPNPILTGEAYAQASTVMSATAKVVNPLALKNASAMGFGSFAVKAAGFLAIDTGGVQTASSNGVKIAAGVAGGVTATAPIGATFVLSVPTYSTATALILKHTVTATQTLKVTKLVYGTFTNAPTTPGANITFLNGAGNFTTNVKLTKVGNTALAVGGRLTFAGTEIPGTYSGTYTLNITF